uniref:SDR family NAD(P)-dependent oxidoreductase n=1 Tax=uncultured organism TaxID=155900 RepID=D9ZEN9_9ZZZZ|nr:putative protein [uncultured organism]
MERKVVLITGGAMGQGKAHALKFAENGFDVVLADMQDPEGEVFSGTVRELEKVGAKVLAVKCNVTSDEDMKVLFEKAWDTFGRLDVVVANAGVLNFGYTWELTDAQVQKVIDIDLIGTWRTDKYAAIYMKKQGFGRIINISSTSGMYGTPKLATYCMAKWGVRGLTKTLAQELKGTGIVVNTVCPTKVKTPMCETESYVEFINDLTGKDFKNWRCTTVFHSLMSRISPIWYSGLALAVRLASSAEEILHLTSAHFSSKAV